RRPNAFTEQRVDIRVLRVDGDAALARYGPDELMELPQDRVEVRINIRVVVLDIRDRERSRPVVHELRALIEERGVVFVGFDDEILRAAEPRGNSEIRRNAADEKTGLEPRIIEDPRKHARRRRLAVRPRDGEHPFVLQHVVREPDRKSTRLNSSHVKNSYA